MTTTKKVKLDNHEEEVLDFIENQNPESIENLESEINRYQQIAKNQTES